MTSKNVSNPKSIIESHINEKCDLLLNHPITVDGHINDELAIKNDYMGRALYELLQNAVDRAEKRILISLNEATNSLIVSNDGLPLGLSPRSDEELSDFESLCSLHTSNKQPGGSIGNKGVGFKSVWEFCNSIQIRSKYGEGNKPWGFRLRYPFKSNNLDDWEDKDIAEKISSALKESRLQKKNKGMAPSFYFPEYLDKPKWNQDDLITEIELEGISQKSFQKLEELIQNLLDNPLYFVGDICIDRQLTLLVQKPGEDAEKKRLYVDDSEWIRLTPDVSQFENEIIDAMDELQFELKDINGDVRLPRLSVIFPKTHDFDFDGLIHSYLPTEEQLHVPMHVQGDFYLSESRKHIEFDDVEYNSILLNIIADAILESIELNKNGLAEQTYISDILSGWGALSNLFDARLKNKGKRLGDIFISIIRNRPNEDKTVDFYQDIYDKLYSFKPSKTHHYYSDHIERALEPYYKEFCREDLKIVPTEFADFDGENGSQLVTNACSLPIIDEEKPSSDIIFCIDNNSTLDQSIEIPGIVVTKWEFNPPPMANTLRGMKLFQQYEKVPLLRAIIRAQNNTVSDNERIKLLVAAVKLVDPDSMRLSTEWCFLSKDTIYPSARLLVPVIDDERWGEARFSYISDDKNILHKHIDSDAVKKVNVELCEDLFGRDYSSLLRGIGVWDCVPLIKDKKSKSWMMALNSVPIGDNGLEIFSKSYSTWRDAENQNIDNIIDVLSSTPWLTVDSGSDQPVSPSSAFFGQSYSEVTGYNLLNSDMLSDNQCDFLYQLGVTRLNSTKDIDKLVDLSIEIVTKKSDFPSFRSANVATYRKILKRINKLLLSDDYEVDDTKLNLLPLLFENNSHDRGIAPSDETIWFLPGSQAKSKSKFSGGDVKWWLASGDVATLAKRLERIETFSLKQRIDINGIDVHDNDLYKWFGKNYLPKFLSVAIYGDIGGVSNVDEEAIQDRWQGVSLLRVESATLVENISASTEEILSDISDVGILWAASSLEKSRELVLYIGNEFSVEDEKVRRGLCKWFAEEVFRQRGLAVYFDNLTSNKSFDDYGVSQTCFYDMEKLISGWLPSHLLEELLPVLSEISGVTLSQGTWRNVRSYRKSSKRFDEIQKELPTRLRSLIDFLNPVNRNHEGLMDFIADHKNNLAALPEEFNKTIDEWVHIFESDLERYKISFSPKIWLLDKLSMQENEFDELANKLDALKDDLINEDDANTTPVEEDPENVDITSTDLDADNGDTTNLVDTQDDDERLDKQKKKSKSGKNLEKRVAIESAIRANKSSEEEKNHLFTLVSKEYLRLGKSDNLVTEIPKSEVEWLKVLHIGDLWDGAGYDVLDYDKQENKLILIEVKSSRRNPPEILFSEPERKHYLRYFSAKYLDSYPWGQWKLYLGTKERYADVTESFIQILEEHNRQLNTVNSLIKSKGWILKNISLSS